MNYLSSTSVCCCFSLAKTREADAKKKSGAAAAAEVAALRELRRDLMAGLGWERLAAAETKKILDDYPNRVGAI